ncbi:hypothetical protein AHAS_Ahas07G0169700 [Arachis hypogaea]
MFSKKGDGKGDVTAAELRDPDVVRTNGALRVRNKTRTGGSVQHVTEYEITWSNEEVGQPSHSSHPHPMHDLNFGTINESRVDEAILGSYGSGLREGTVGGLDVEDAKTSKLMDMVASLAKAL